VQLGQAVLPLPAQVGGEIDDRDAPTGQLPTDLTRDAMGQRQQDEIALGRRTTHSVRQHAAARLMLFPYNIGWHLAHHVDSGIPFRNLPKLHAALRESGYVDSTIEYASYPAIWKALRRPADVPATPVPA
jgi:fatty acid desaturase